MTTQEMKRELGSLIWKTATSLVHGGKVSQQVRLRTEIDRIVEELEG